MLPSMRAEDRASGHSGPLGVVIADSQPPPRVGQGEGVLGTPTLQPLAQHNTRTLAWGCDKGPLLLGATALCSDQGLSLWEHPKNSREPHTQVDSRAFEGKHRGWSLFAGCPSPCPLWGPGATPGRFLADQVTQGRALLLASTLITLWQSGAL